MKSKLCVPSLCLLWEMPRDGTTNLDPSKTKVGNKLVNLFVDQFIFNTMIDVTLRDLEITKQGLNETFSKYMLR